MHRPFGSVVEAVLWVLPKSDPRHAALEAKLMAYVVEEKDQMRQWRMLADALKHYMAGSSRQLKEKVIQILQDPTEYRYVLKLKEKAEMNAPEPKADKKGEL